MLLLAFYLPKDLAFGSGSMIETFKFCITYGSVYGAALYIIVSLIGYGLYQALKLIRDT